MIIRLAERYQIPALETLVKTKLFSFRANPDRHSDEIYLPLLPHAVTLQDRSQLII